MDTQLYEAAMEGNLEVLLQQKDQLEAQVTPNKNSVLHVAALFNKSNVVKEILTAQPLLLCRVNIKGETALHIAAREGHYSTVQALIECAKEDDSEVEIGIGMAEYLSRMVNNDGNTALHEAVWNKEHLNIVNLLVEADPEFSHLANNDKETPLYIAAERGFEDIVSKILNTCTSPGCSGPDGRNALHGAVISKSEGCTTQLLEWKQSLTKESDIHGWTVLHYAAIGGLLSGVTQLLDADKSVAYLTTKEDNNMTPLHLAVIWGKIDVMEMLISRCPDCWEMVDSKGQNILHLASRHMQWKVINFILKDSSLSSLINQKDDEGNTPLHVVAASRLNFYNLRHSYKVLRMIWNSRVDKSALNKEKLTPFDVAIQNNSQNLWVVMNIAIQVLAAENCAEVGGRQDGRNLLKRKCEILEKKGWRCKDIKKMGDTQLIVAAFIATVTFAAGFTLPGGYASNEGKNQGMAVLSRAAAFKAFVIFDTIAMISSTYAMFLHFIATFYEDRETIKNRYFSASGFLAYAMVAMVMAFVTGMYAVLEYSMALAISVCSIVGCYSLVFLIFQTSTLGLHN